MPMQPNKFIALFGLFNALTLGAANMSASAGPEKGGAVQRGGRAAVHMSAKGQENNNAQWSADPDRGWVRADERHELHERQRSSANAKSNQGKAAAKGSRNDKQKKKGK